MQIFLFMFQQFFFSSFSPNPLYYSFVVLETSKKFQFSKQKDDIRFEAIIRAVGQEATDS